MLQIALMMLFISVGIMVWFVMPDVSKRMIRRRVFAEVAYGEKLTTIGQLAEMLSPINRLLPTTWYADLYRTRIEAAGLRMTPIQFLVLQEIGAITGLFLYTLLIGFEKMSLPGLLAFVLGGFFVPSIWLGNRINTRKFTISRDLPEIVDLLSLCVDAGLDFMNALNKIVREFRRCPTTEELGIVLQEVRVGKRRRDALRAFSQRIQTPETSSFTRTLVQADRMGTGIAEALRVLSEDMRLQRYHWAERFAQQAPMKMLLPLMLSLASALTIVTGPILGQFLAGGASSFSPMAAGK